LRFLPFFPEDLEGVTGTGDVAGVVSISEPVVEIDAAPFGGFEAEGMEVFGNAANDEEMA